MKKLPRLKSRSCVDVEAEARRVKAEELDRSNYFQHRISEHKPLQQPGYLTFFAILLILSVYLDFWLHGFAVSLSRSAVCFRRFSIAFLTVHLFLSLRTQKYVHTYTRTHTHNTHKHAHIHTRARVH